MDKTSPVLSSWDPDDVLSLAFQIVGRTIRESSRRTKDLLDLLEECGDALAAGIHSENLPSDFWDWFNIEYVVSEDGVDQVSLTYHPEGLDGPTTKGACLDIPMRGKAERPSAFVCRAVACDRVEDVRDLFGKKGS